MPFNISSYQPSTWCNMKNAAERIRSEFTSRINRILEKKVSACKEKIISCFPYHPVTTWQGLKKKATGFKNSTHYRDEWTKIGYCMYIMWENHVICLGHEKEVKRSSITEFWVILYTYVQNYLYIEGSLKTIRSILRKIPEIILSHKIKNKDD